MGAVLEEAALQVGAKLPKGLRQGLRLPQFTALGVEGGEARCIRHQPPRQGEELHMAGGVPAPAQLGADLPGG